MKDPDLPTPVLEIGGTHVTAALVQGGDFPTSDVSPHRVARSRRSHRRLAARTHHSIGQARVQGLGGGVLGDGDDGIAGWAVVAGSVVRQDLDAHAPADVLLDALAAAANSLGEAHTGRWGVALPGPFDYETGIARYEHVGKFDRLQGVDVRAGLAERLRRKPRSITFLNDADAFGIGEFALGAAGGIRRAVCITLGTGVGSAFLADGVPVKTGPDVPPDGSCYLLEYRGRPLEDTVSRRAIRRAYAAKTGTETGAAARGTLAPEENAENYDAATPDVRGIAAASRAGDAVAAKVLDDAFAAVGEATGPYLRRFGAEVLIVGGSMADSWDIVEPAIRRGLTTAVPGLAALPIQKAERPHEAGLIGAAYWAHHAQKRDPPPGF